MGKVEITKGVFIQGNQSTLRVISVVLVFFLILII